MAEETTTKQRTLQGLILKKSGINTLKVRVETKQQHALYKRIVRTHKNYLVDYDETGEFAEVEIGDEVLIGETRPVSKNKTWELLSIVKKA